jgi:hypothetical protein
MATITVECPTCRSELEIDAQYRNQEVECGSCNQVFIAKPRREETERRPSSRRQDRDDWDEPQERRTPQRGDPPRSRRANRYEDEDDYEDYERQRTRRQTKQGTGLGDASLILGIVAMFVFCCPPIGIPLTIIGLVLGVLGCFSTNNGTAIAGLILNGLFLLVSVGFLFGAWMR